MDYERMTLDIIHRSYGLYLHAMSRQHEKTDRGAREWWAGYAEAMRSQCRMLAHDLRRYRDVAARRRWAGPVEDVEAGLWT